MDGEEVMLNENEHTRCVELIVECRYIFLYFCKNYEPMLTYILN